jgi:uncharacterized membrane protein YeiH
MAPAQPSFLLSILDFAGISVSAVSGALAAGRRHLDLLGVAVVATVTAIGGGTLRDLLLDRHPVFWIADPDYLLVILGTATVTILYTRIRAPPARALLIADAWALGLFTVTGARIAEGAGLAWLLIVVMATITAVAGGAIRDVLCTEVPLVMRSGNLYASAAIAGATIWVWARWLGATLPTASFGGALVVVGLRLAAIIYDLRLPVYHLDHPEGP